jgi:hypothetical protein
MGGCFEYLLILDPGNKEAAKELSSSDDPIHDAKPL